MPEQRFQELRKTLKTEEFNNVNFLKQKAEKIKTQDPDLSERILMRVKNLTNADTTSHTSKNDTEVSKTKQKTSAIIEVSSNSSISFLNNIPVINQLNFQKMKKYPFLIFVLLPTILFAMYQALWATERFESQSQVIVQQPDNIATMDAGMALLSGMGVPTGNSDTELIKAYIYSNDMILFLRDKLDLRKHFSQSYIDYFSRIHENDTREDLLEYYYQRVKVEVDEKSGVITVYVQGFDSEYAQKFAKTIVERAEWFINSIGHQLANAQLSFIQGEHAIVEKRLQQAQTDLLNFQQRYNLLDPTAEGMAMQEIAYSLRAEVAKKQAELKALKSVMSSRAPQVIAVTNEISALKTQLESEKSKLAQTKQDAIPVSEILARFTDYKVKMELALQAYTSSQISLEKSRIEAYRQIKYLIVVERATLSEEYKYPEIIYNITLFFILLSMAFFIAKIIFVTIKELK